MSSIQTTTDDDINKTIDETLKKLREAEKEIDVYNSAISALQDEKKQLELNIKTMKHNLSNLRRTKLNNNNNNNNTKKKKEEAMFKPDHPANQQAIAYLKTIRMDGKLSESPRNVSRWNLGIHPDMVDWFWSFKEETCAWVVYGRPVLVHPFTGVIFGVPKGGRVLRLPSSHNARRGRVVVVPEVGDDWFQSNEKGDESVQQAYDYAGKL